MRDHWRMHFQKAKCMIYVIDATDRRRLHENSIELRRLLDSPRLVGVPLLLLANKQDLAGALPASEIEACLHLRTIRDRAWNCLGCSAFRGEGEGDGFVRGLKWLAAKDRPQVNEGRGRPEPHRNRQRSAVPEDLESEADDSAREQDQEAAEDD